MSFMSGFGEALVVCAIAIAVIALGIGVFIGWLIA
jgi:hypothetical protein